MLCHGQKLMCTWMVGRRQQHPLPAIARERGARDGDAPQQGTPEGVTSCAHSAAICSNALVVPSFLLEQGTCSATLSRTGVHSSLSFRWLAMKSAGSYSENLIRAKPRGGAAPGQRKQLLRKAQCAGCNIMHAQPEQSCALHRPCRLLQAMLCDGLTRWFCAAPSGRCWVIKDAANQGLPSDPAVVWIPSEDSHGREDSTGARRGSGGAARTAAGCR